MAERQTFEDGEDDELAARAAEDGATPPDDDDEDGKQALSEEEKAWEVRARRMGWLPLSEWRGDPALHRSAREFVERGENNQPILIERLHKLEARFDAQGKQLNDANAKLQESTEVMKSLYAWAQRADERAYDRAVTELRAKQRIAVAEANTDAYDEAQTAIENLEAGRGNILPKEPPAAPAPEPTPPAADAEPEKDPTIEAWVIQNASWWNDSDTEAKDTAIALYSTLTVSKPNWSTQQKLDDILKRIKKMYPERFSNPRRSQPAPVNEPGGPGGDRRRRTKDFSYEDLPRAEQRECDRFVKSIPGFTKEAYVKEYIRQNGDTRS